MESQNHYYGHSLAFAHYLGARRPRHIAGLVQHGWASVSPVRTHFRDFPALAAPGYRGPNKLLVWSHASRAWDAAAEPPTTAIGAPFVYEVASRGGVAAIPEGAGSVILPVHGIETQAMQGDHRAVAKRWYETEGPSTVSIYWSDAHNPNIVDAYLEAGHRCVTLGKRTDPDFLGRLVTLLSNGRRVVSNRISTPIVYAGWLGRDVGIYGDPMLLEQEDASTIDRLQKLWPELYGYQTDVTAAAEVATAEIGASHLLGAEELRRTLGWDRPRVAPFARHWTTSVLERALVNVRRRSSGPAASANARDATSGGHGLSLAWFRAAMSYLPKPLGVGTPSTQPLELTAAIR